MREDGRNLPQAPCCSHQNLKIGCSCSHKKLFGSRNNFGVWFLQLWVTHEALHVFHLATGTSASRNLCLVLCQEAHDEYRYLSVSQKEPKPVQKETPHAANPGQWKMSLLNRFVWPPIIFCLVKEERDSDTDTCFNSEE